MKPETQFCKSCLKDKPKDYFAGGRYPQCIDCLQKKYFAAELIADPQFTLSDYQRAFPLHPMDKYGRK